MKRVKTEKKEWLEACNALKASYKPVSCSRCSRAGNGWSDLDSHHMAGRHKLWRLMPFIPLCRPYHNLVHAHPNEARAELWLLKP